MPIRIPRTFYLIIPSFLCLCFVCVGYWLAILVPRILNLGIPSLLCFVLVCVGYWLTILFPRIFNLSIPSIYGWYRQKVHYDIPSVEFDFLCMRKIGTGI